LVLVAGAIDALTNTKKFDGIAKFSGMSIGDADKVDEGVCTAATTS
jgi:hypothetical protein